MHRMSLVLLVAIASFLFTSASAARDPESLKKYFQEQFPEHKIVPDGHGSWKAVRDVSEGTVKESYESLSISTGIKEKAVDYDELEKKYGRRFAVIAKEHHKKTSSVKLDTELYIHQEYNFEECATLPSEDPAKFKGRFQFWCDEEQNVWVRQFEQDGCKGKSNKKRLHMDSPIQVKCLSSHSVEINEPYMVPLGNGRKDDVLFWECDCKEKARENYVAGNCRLVRESKKVFEDSVKDYISLDGGDARCRINIKKEVERATTRRQLADDARTTGIKTGVDFTGLEDAFGQEVPQTPEDFKFGNCKASEMGEGLKDSGARTVMDVGGVAVQTAFEDALCKVLDGYTEVCSVVDEVVCKTVETALCPHTWLPWEWWKKATKWHCDITYEWICHPEIRKHCESVPNWIKDCTQADPSDEQAIAHGETIAQDVLGKQVLELGEECGATDTTDMMKKAIHRRRLRFQNGQEGLESFHLQASKPTRVKVTDGERTDETTLEAMAEHRFRATNDEVTIELLDNNPTKLRSKEFMKISNDKIWQDEKCDTLKENRKVCDAVRKGELVKGIYRVSLKASKFTLKAQEGMEVTIQDGASLRHTWISPDTREFYAQTNAVEIFKKQASDISFTFHTDEQFRTQDVAHASECYYGDSEVTMNDERCQKFMNGQDIKLERVRFHFLKNIGQLNSRGIKGSLSSVYRSSMGAEKCLDGRTDTMCHGKNKKGDELVLTFPETIVTEVILENRRGCCKHRIQGAKVWAGNDLCGIVDVQSNTISVICPAVKTNQIKIKTYDYLNLAEVKVMHERSQAHQKDNIDGPVDIEVGGAELTTVWGFIGLGNGKMPKDSEWAHKDCSKDIWPYRGPTFGVPPVGLTLCASVSFSSKQINICVGFIFTNDGFFLPHWSYGLSWTTSLLEANAYLNLYAFASSGAAFLGNHNRVTLKYPIKKASYASLDAGLGFTFATKPDDKWTDSDFLDNWIIDKFDHGLGPNSRLVAYSAIVGVSVSLSKCDLPFMKELRDDNGDWADWFLGCGNLRRTNNIDSAFGKEWKPAFKPFEVMCLSDMGRG